MTVRTPRARIIAVVAAAVVGTTAAAAGLANEGSSDGATIFAEFADASPLLVGNDVQIGGVKVGQVESIEVQNGRARVGMHLEPEALPVHIDARTTIRPVSLLGERYVALERGSPSTPVISDGGVVPVQQTGRATDLDQVLNAVDKPTGQALAMVVTTLGEGMRGQGNDVDAAVRALSPAMKDTATLTRVLNEQNALLSGLVDRTQPVASALAREDGRTLDGLVGSTEQLLGTVAANQQAVDASLAQLPGTMSAAREALSRVAGVAERTTPTLREMRPTTNNLNAISTELQRFSEAADPALASAQPVLNRGRELLDQAAPVVRDLEAAGPDLRGTAAGLRPVGTALTDNLGNVLDFVRFWALTTNGRDGVSHYFRAHQQVNVESNHEAPHSPAPPLPGPGPLPGLPGELPPPGLSGLTGPLDNTGAPPTGPDGGATGLSPEQERSMADQVLGGQ